jgi:hypothetical protein
MLTAVFDPLDDSGRSSHPERAMERERFFNLTTPDVAALVRAARPRLSCGLPINGSRRWYALERLAQPAADEATDRLQDYIDTTIPQQIAVHRMLYAHGVHTIVYPLFGGDLLGRGEAYVRAMMGALARIFSDPRLRAFYDEYDVQVRVYGDYARALSALAHGELAGQYDELMAATAGHATCRLLYGLWAEDAADACAAASVDFFRREGRAPTRAELVRAYYGTDVEWLDCFVGFERPVVFDVPLLLGPETALYFTLTPSLGLDERTWRTLLYDLLYVRAAPDPDGLQLDAGALLALQAYYAAHAGEVLGAGTIDPQLGVWVPAHRSE